MKLIRLITVLLTAALIAAACGGDSDNPIGSSGVQVEAEEQAAIEEEADEAEEEAALEDDAAMEEEAEAEQEQAAADAVGQPAAIVSLSPSSTEILFAIGAGEQVIAVDSFSNYPAEAPITDLSASEPNTEAILGFEPDLVITSGSTEEFVAAMDAAGVPVLQQFAAASIDDTYAQIEQLGAETGHVAEAAELVLNMQTEVGELAAQATGSGTYYHELDDTLFSVTTSTFIGNVYSIAGLTNVADAADPDGEFFGFPQLNAEFLVDADPDLIFLADTKCCGQNAETVSARPGWDTLTAVQEGRIFELDDDIASRWGPRVVDFLRIIVEATATISS